MADEWIDYWYDFHELPGGAKKLETYAYGALIDTQEDSSGSKSWGELIAAAQPAIIQDIAMYGVAS